MVVSIVSPFSVIPGLDGVPLDGAFVYIGAANTNPLTQGNRLSLFSDAAMTVPLANPFRTRGGFPVANNGALCNVYCATDFSMTVCDSDNSALYTLASYGFRIFSDAITFGTLILSTGIEPSTAGGAFNGRIAKAWSNVVSYGAQVRSLSIYQDDQPAVADDFARLSQLMMPLAGCIYRVTPTLSNAFNVASVTVNGVGDYNVNLTVAAPVGVVVCVATADTAVRQAIADIDVGRTFIHVTTFNTNTGAAAASGFHLHATCDAAVADPIL